MLSQANPVARPLSLITAITKIHSESTLSHGHLTAKCYCNPSRVPQILNGWSVNWQHRNLKNISFHVSKSMGSQESSSWGLEAQKSSKAKKDMANSNTSFKTRLLVWVADLVIKSNRSLMLALNMQRSH